MIKPNQSSGRTSCSNDMNSFIRDDIKWQRDIQEMGQFIPELAILLNSLIVINEIINTDK